MNWDDLKHLASVSRTPPYHADEAIHARFMDGYRLFALKAAERMVSFAWVGLRPDQWVSEVDVVLAASPISLWIIDCVTPREHRGHGYYPRLLQHIVRDADGRRTFIYCDENNKASRRGIEKAGFIPLLTMASQFGRLTSIALHPEAAVLSVKRK
ncbi:MAG: GNAT family N-acetyltransferase [Gemmatimonadaceae bacterium]